MSLKEEIQSYVISLLSEGVESKNMKLAKHFLYDKFGYDEATAMKVIGSIKTDIPNSRLGKCKFMLAMVRMYANGEFNDAEVIMNVNKCLKYAASNAHINEYDNDLNGLSSVEFLNRFSGVAQEDLQNDMNDISSQDYSENNEYDIVKISSFDESSEYGDFVDWCVTYDKNMWNAYTKGGNGVFYFCLRDGYENEERVEGEGCPLDSYGLSMIAVSVNSDGSCNTITCRWNHANNGNDNIMTTKQLSELLGVNFYNTFKPLTEEEIKRNKAEMIYEIEEELSSYMGYESPEEMGCDKKEYDPDYGDTIEKDVYVFLSDTADGCVLIDDNWNLLCTEIFDRIGGREGDILTVNRGNEMNFLTLDGNLLSESWFDQVQNNFEYGVGLVRKGNSWNAIRKDGSFIFGKWYVTVSFHGRRKASASYFQIMNDRKSFMFADMNAQPMLDRWFTYIFRANGDNVFFKFEDSPYYELYDSKYNIKAPYKIIKLLGYYLQSYYKIKLDDGKDYYINNNGDLIDIDTEEILYKVNRVGNPY